MTLTQQDVTRFRSLAQEMFGYSLSRAQARAFGTKVTGLIGLFLGDEDPQRASRATRIIAHTVAQLLLREIVHPKAPKLRTKRPAGKTRRS